MNQDVSAMTVNPGIEIQQLALPHSGVDLISLVWHKGSPWVEDIDRRARAPFPDADDYFFVADANGQMVAVAWYTTCRTDPTLGLIGHIYTRAEYRQQGISTRLVQAAMSDFRDRGGAVMQLFSSTPYTIPFYERLGFENLYANQVYHETDWYMRYPADSQRQIAAWYAGSPEEIRPLSAGDLPQYCLLYNLEHGSVLKDWAQSIGMGLEAELAFINSLAKIAKGEGVCYALENERTIIGIASLMRQDFPHHSHVAMLDLYMYPETSPGAECLIEACLAYRDRIGAEIIYAMGVDQSKREMLARLGFRAKAVLPGHYKVRSQYFDGELFAHEASR
jgi:N-acetylglutamate synthase-like GNAT family acetyltransferase